MGCWTKFSFTASKYVAFNYTAPKFQKNKFNTVNQKNQKINILKINTLLRFLQLAIRLVLRKYRQLMA